MVFRTQNSLKALLGIPVVAGLACLAMTWPADRSQAEKAAKKKANDNGKCYVCHAGMKTEELTTSHLAMKVTCDKCHGPSIEHMHDEMLMTKPDKLFGRSQVAAMCKKCHEEGHEHPEKVAAFRKEWTARILPNGRNITDDSVCTDCHGTHNVANNPDAETQQQQEEPWLAAFNGTDLTGWKSSDGSTWKVKMGRIHGGSSTDAKTGSLWSEAEYDDYLTAVTFRVERPISAGIWVRGDGSKPGVRVEILQDVEPKAHSGSVLVTEKGWALINPRSGLLDEGGWNTMSIKAEGDRVQVWLNGEEIGAVHTGGPTKGRIGFYTAGKGGEFCIREVQIQKLGKSEEPE